MQASNFLVVKGQAVRDRVGHMRAGLVRSRGAAAISAVLIVVSAALLAMTTISVVRTIRDVGTACNEHALPTGAVVGEGYESAPKGSVWLVPPILVCEVPMEGGDPVTVLHDIDGWQLATGIAFAVAGGGLLTLRRKTERPPQSL